MTDDLVYFNNPPMWPRWPFLPIKRKGDPKPECATLRNRSFESNDLEIVYAGFYDSKEVWEKAKREPITVKDLTNQGWVVD